MVFFCPKIKVSHLATTSSSLCSIKLRCNVGGAVKFDNSAFYDLISQEVHHVIVAHVVVAFFRLRIGFRFRTGLMSCF